MPTKSPLSADLWHASVAALSARALRAEETAVAELLTHTGILERDAEGVNARATALAESLRAEGPGKGVEAFLAEYGLDTREGIAVMCLAEALLRIPDAATAQALIRDKFSQGEWNTHLGQSESLLVNAASWGLLLTGTVLDLSKEKPKSAWSMVSGLTRKLGEPTIRQALKTAMKVVGGQFVLGETIEEALANGKGATKKGYRFSYDILGEGARTVAQADHYLHAYHHAIPLIAAARAKGAGLFDGPGISVKLSGLHPRYSLAQEARVRTELFARLKSILLLAKEHDICVALDAEEANRLDIELLLFHHLATDSDLAGWNGLGFVVQAYGKRALGVIELLAQLAKSTGRIFPLRLVKGAYWDSEIKHAQVMGLADYPVYTRKEHTDLSYLTCAEAMLSNATHFYCQFGTHNARTVESILTLAAAHQVPREGFEFQRLHGMGEALHERVMDRAGVRIYAPIGAHKDLLAYLIRRLLENGANTSFVHLLLDRDTPIAELLADPILAAQQSQGARSASIPLPQDIYAGAWKNSGGLDLGYIAQRDALLRGLSAPLPAPAPSLEVATACARTQEAFRTWRTTSVDERAAMLERAADLLEQHLAPLVQLLAEEGGRTLADGISEVREAADFCRYYAQSARRLFAPLPLPGPTGESNRLLLAPRGTFACIAPWNFPLAIFLGQIAAALAAGNTVIAKPAEQTPRIAQAAIALLRLAGIPENVVALCIGDGESVGAPLVADPRIAGVAFTGSDATARAIHRALAAKNGPIVPLIAETGGLNAMIVDSSALLEQAVDDIVLSAYGSAGQRCSALRLLFVQEDVADAMEVLIAGSMAELRLGNPALPETDIGPVIDAEAKAMLEAHISRMTREARLVAQCPAPAEPGHFVPPTAFALPSAGMLTKEIFGPVLHIVRWKAEELAQVVEAVNASGYGLTFGIHSRIDATIDYCLRHITAGNIYVNRSMIGATVGVQPFGGEGLSGTGPKAGGPHYLLRFASERTQTINSAAIGGNLALLQ